MNFKRLLNNPVGQFFVSVLLGLGLATLFRRVCTDKSCLVFHGPVIQEFEGKIYRHGEKCYQYKVTPNKCDSTKRIIDISEQSIEPEQKPVFNF